MAFSASINLTSTMKDFLCVQNLSVSINGVPVLRDVSFTLEQGSSTVLFGENGSGKTTLFHVISGFLKANEGKILLKHRDLTDLTPMEISAMGVGRGWQKPRICGNLTVLDNLMLSSRDHPGEKLSSYLIEPRAIFRKDKELREAATAISSELELVGKLGDTAASLSFGQQKLLSLGMLIMNDAQLLILDEPFAGVSASMVRRVSDILLKLKGKGKTVFFIEHNRDKAISISENILTLIQGSMQRESINQT